MEIKTKKTEEFERVKIEEGLYEARLKDIKTLGEKTYPDGNVAETALMIFEVWTDKERSKVVELSHYIPDATASEGNKFGKALAALKANISWGESFETNVLTGAECKVMVEDYKKDDITASSITKVKPMVSEETVE